MKRLLHKSVLYLCKYLFVTNRSLAIINCNAFPCLKKLSIVCQIPDVFALTRLANFFQKHLKKCFIVVLTGDAHYMAEWHVTYN